MYMYILLRSLSGRFTPEAGVCRPVGGRDSSSGGRVKTEEDGKKAQRPGTIQRERSIYIYIEPPHLIEEGWWFV
jgi:hypothetical protein